MKKNKERTFPIDALIEAGLNLKGYKTIKGRKSLTAEQVEALFGREFLDRITSGNDWLSEFFKFIDEEEA
jgi:hypothetical protein